MADVSYRFVRGQVATLDDFRSQGALGRKLRSSGDERAFNQGVSVYDDFAQACEVAASIRYRRGSYLAVIEELLALVAGRSMLIPGAPEG